LISNRYAVLIYGRNEAENIESVFRSLDNQTIKPVVIIYVDDCSSDDSVDILDNIDCKYLAQVRLRVDHPSFVGKKELGQIVNQGIDLLYRFWPRYKFDSFMIGGGDIIYDPLYCQCMIQKMKEDPLLMICSGKIIGEKFNKNFPRGAGRFHNFNFWDKYVSYYPNSYIWESFPVYKALSLGFHVRALEDSFMFSLRPTTSYKEGYGRAMRELGYFPFYALIRCLLGFFKDRRIGLEIFKSYLSGGQVYDKKIQDFVRLHQINKIKGLIGF